MFPTKLQACFQRSPNTALGSCLSSWNEHSLISLLAAARVRCLTLTWRLSLSNMGLYPNSSCVHRSQRRKDSGNQDWGGGQAFTFCHSLYFKKKQKTQMPSTVYRCWLSLYVGIWETILFLVTKQTLIQTNQKAASPSKQCCCFKHLLYQHFLDFSVLAMWFSKSVPGKPYE